MRNENENWTVLIVDDDPLILGTLQQFLANVHFNERAVRVICTDNSKNARKILSEETIHVALIDLSIEQQDSGLELVRFIRNNLNNYITRLIIITGNVDNNSTSPEFITREFDVNGFILKPRIIQQLLITSIITSLRSYEKLESLQKTLYAQEKSIQKISLQSDKILHTKSILDAIINKAMKVPLIIVSEDLEVSHYNEAAQIFFGVPSEEVLGNSVRDIHKHLNISQPKVRQALKMLKHDGKLQFGITRNINGRDVTCTVSFLSIFLNSDDISPVFVLSGDQQISLELGYQVDSQDEYEDTTEETIKESGIPSIISADAKIHLICDLIKEISHSNASVLITGETGTGKEVCAKAVQQYSVRKDKPYMAINCAALPAELLEAELFGYSKGAFTGADRDKQGIFELCDGGTLFLDEIGDASLPVQAKLLRVLQDGSFLPVGSRKLINVDVRILAATNRNLKDQIFKGNFREDLYYRLNVIPIELPALRLRQVDIVLLAKHFLERYKDRYNIKEERLFSTQCLNALSDYRWPGNIRELQNAIDYVSAVCKERVIHIKHLPESLQKEIAKHGYVKANEPKPQTTPTLALDPKEITTEVIMEVLAECGGNKSLAADRLSMHRSTLYRKIDRIKASGA